MKKQVLFLVVLLAAVGLLAGVAASSAFANAGGYGLPCGMCHGTAGPAPVVTLVTNNGTTATYTVSAPAAHEWAVFNGSTRITGTTQDGNTATAGGFTVPVGSTYTIYAEYEEPGLATHGGQTTVSPAGVTNYTITPTAGAHGSISPTGAQTVASGGSVTFTITPDTGYHVADVLVDDASVGAVTSYPFTNVSANHTISATFAENAPVTYTITTTAGANGAIAPAGPQTVTAGSDATFSITPSAGYYVETLKIDGVDVQPTKSYTFTNVQANHSIEATFAASPTMCTITASVVGATGGAIVPAFPVFTLPPTASVTYYFVPDAGYHVEQVLVNGWPVVLGDDDEYMFASVDRHNTVSVEFARTQWTVTASVTGKGKITPAGATAVIEGDDVTYTFTPDAGNALTDVVVDGQSLGIVGSYTFDDVAANHTIQAKFVTNSVNYTITPSVTGGHGSITPAAAYVVPSTASITFYFWPDEGYMVGTVTVDGTAVAANLVEDDCYLFENVTANHTIAVSYVPAPAQYTITPSAGDHGTISPAEVQTVTSADSTTFTITPDAGYHVADVLVNGQSVGAVGSYTFTNVNADKTISASFAWTKLPTSTTLKASARTVRLNRYVKLTAGVTGGSFTNATIRYEVKKPGQKSFRLLKTVNLSSTGGATYKCKVTRRGNWYFRVKFLGDDTYLPAPVKAGIKVVCQVAPTTPLTCGCSIETEKGSGLWLSKRMMG